MKQLGFYLFRQLITAFIFATAAVSFVVLFTQLFRLLSLVIDNSATLWIFFQLILLSVPTFLPLVLPIGLGVATLFIFHKLAIDSELVVMRAAGVSPMRLATPAFLLAGIVTVVCFLLTLWLTPMANRELVNLQYKVRDSYAVFLSRPGSFNDITDGVTFYAHRRGSGGALEGILIHDVRKPEAPITIMADTGQVVDNGGQPEIIVFNGRRQEMDLTTGKLSELAFDQYVLDLNAMRSGSPQRMPDPREQSVYELLNPSPEMLRIRTTREHLLAELHQRLASPLLALSYTLIALAAILAGEFNRRGMSRRLFIAAVAVIATQATFMSVNGMVARQIWLSPLLYLVTLAPTPLGLMLLNSEYLRRWLPSPLKKTVIA